LEDTFSLDVFINTLKRKKGRLKSKLVDQTFLSGIGNCYSDEICFHSRVKPTRNIAELTESEQKNLYQSIQSVLREAIIQGGYLQNPFYKGDTHTGGFIRLCQVYDREGKGCNRCSTPIIKDEISSRKSFFCPNCQK
jgi:formamidopyrimidine-DNA glycosylase